MIKQIIKNFNRFLPFFLLYGKFLVDLYFFIIYDVHRIQSTEDSFSSTLLILDKGVSRIMVIYGVAILAGCFLVGTIVGEFIGALMGVDSNVGGVGIAMLLLIVVVDKLVKSGKIAKPSLDGLSFWNQMYIPVVIAMAASQNVLGALTGGPLAIIAGIAVVVISWACVPLLSGKQKEGETSYSSTAIRGEADA